MKKKITPLVPDSIDVNLTSIESKDQIVRFSNIQWNTDDFDVLDLPTEVLVHIDEFRNLDIPFELFEEVLEYNRTEFPESIKELEESISVNGADFLSDNFDFLIDDFDFEIIADNGSCEWFDKNGSIIVQPIYKSNN